MARPKTKEDLLIAAKDNYNKLLVLIDSLSEDEKLKEFIFEDRDRNVKDVLTHLYEWHQLLLNWVESNQKGQNISFLPEPYNWRTYTQMNVELILKKHIQTKYIHSREMLNQSHHQVIRLIQSFSNDALFSKGVFTWTGGTTLGSYCVSTTSSHYDWAIKKIKKQIKLLKDLKL